jgi:hypothetical protein
MNDNYVDYPVAPSYWLKVIGDTILQNGKTYKKIKQGYFDRDETYWRFERIDSTTSSVYRIYENKEYKIDSLISKPNDKIICSRFYIWFKNYTTCLFETEEILFDRKYIVKTMKDFTTSMAYKYKLVKGLGYYYSESRELTFQGDKLKYAIISGVEHGIKTNAGHEENIPVSYSLSQNYPNPFNPETTIEYAIPVKTRHASSLQHVTLKVYNVLGREVATLVDEYKQAGNYKVKLNAGHLERSREMTSGVYFYQLKAGSSVETKKMIMLK